MPTKYFRNPFAVNGDKTAIPDATQPDGSVSYDTGFTFDYERDPDPLVDPLTKDVPREETNQLFNDITGVLKFLQERTAPEWSATIAANIGGYPLGARVSLEAGGAIYTSTAANNTAVPGGAGVTTWITTSVLDATLVALAGLATGANKLPYFTGTDTAAQTDFTSFARQLLAAANPAAGRSALEVGAASNLVAGLIRTASQTDVNTGAVGNVAVLPSQLVNGFNFIRGGTGEFKFPTPFGEFIIAWNTITPVPAGAVRLARTFPNFAFGCVPSVIASGSDGGISTPTGYTIDKSTYIRNQDNNQLALFVISLGW